MKNNIKICNPDKFLENFMMLTGEDDITVAKDFADKVINADKKIRDASSIEEGDKAIGEIYAELKDDIVISENGIDENSFSTLYCDILYYSLRQAGDFFRRANVKI